MLQAASNWQRFAYDKLYRLTEVQDGSGTMMRWWTYDGVGNRLSEETPGSSGGGGGDGDGGAGGGATSGGVVDYTYAVDSHRLVDVGGQPRTYDAVGNTRQKGDLELIYSDANRLSEVRRGYATLGRYTYNGLGQRVVKEAGGATVHFLYDESGKLLFEFNMTAGITEYVWLGDLLIGVVQNGDSFAIETDHLGAPRLATNAYGSLAWRWTQWDNAFGDYPADSVGDSDGAALELNVRFPGQYYDAESGLHYNYFRDYEPSTGRYVQSDPIGLRGGIGTYSYVSSNPLGNVDPLGLIEWSGTYFSASASFGVGYGVFLFQLTSECVDGKRLFVKLRASGPSASFKSSNLGLGGSWATFEDGAESLDSNSLVGAFGIYQGGGAAGLGAGCSAIFLGDGASVGCDLQAGYGGGAYSGFVGRSKLTTVLEIECDECE